jgi:hypothetical protein
VRWILFLILFAGCIPSYCAPQRESRMWLGADSDRFELSSRTSRFASCGGLGRRTIVCLFAATALTGANALALTTLYASPAGATSAAVAQVKEDDDDRQACHGHTGDPYYPAAGFGPVVKAVTITEPGGTRKITRPPTRVRRAPNSGSSRALPSP